MSVSNQILHYFYDHLGRRTAAEIAGAIQVKEKLVTTQLNQLVKKGWLLVDGESWYRMPQEHRRFMLEVSEMMALMNKQSDSAN